MYRFDKTNHIHELFHENVWKPLIGVSRVGEVIARPLHWWAAGKAVETLGWTNSKKKVGGEYVAVLKEERLAILAPKFAEIQRMAPAEFLALLDIAYRAHDITKKEAATGGTDLHAEVEKFVKAQMEGETFEINDGNVRVLPFIQWAKENVKRFLWSELHCFSAILWLGGISDVGAELNDGQIAVLDIKSSKEAYASQFWQCGGYDILISENGGYTADGHKIFELPSKVGVHIVFPFGAEKPCAQAVYDVESNREAFAAEVLLYKKQNLINEIK